MHLEWGKGGWGREGLSEPREALLSMPGCPCPSLQSPRPPEAPFIPAASGGGG